MNSKAYKLALAIKRQKEINIKKIYKRFSERYLWITNKKGEKVKLIQNNAQNILDQTIEDLKAAGKPPRIIILKSRQMGMTTDIEGRMTKETTTKKNRNGLVVAHEDYAVKSIFKKTKYYYDNLEPDVQPLKKASNAKELIFDVPSYYKGEEEGLNSSITVQIAGSDGIGRSNTLHYVHLSEYAFWKGSDSNAPDKQLTGILQAVPDTLDTWVIIESTANGMNHFKQEWDKAVKGQSAFTPLFLPWYIHEEYVKDPLELEGIITKLDFIKTMSSYEKEILFETLKLPLERIAWWRWAKKNKCNGDINQMKQENPTTPEEAFIFSGTPVFDNDKVTKRITELESASKPYKEGYFKFKWNKEEWKDFIINDSIEFVESNTKKYWRIYEDPKKDYPYVLAGDTAGQGKDFFTAQIMDNTNSNRVATCEMDINNSKPYTWQVYCAGLYFNTALVGIEMNFNTAPLEELVRLKYKKMYYREKNEGFRGETQRGKIGWKTDGITRPRMIDKEVYFVDEYLNKIYDIPTLQQMLTFVYDKDGRPDAMPGCHDDLLIAECMLNEISDQQTTQVKKKKVKRFTQEDQYSEVMTDWR